MQPCLPVLDIRIAPPLRCLACMALMKKRKNIHGIWLTVFLFTVACTGQESKPGIERSSSLPFDSSRAFEDLRNVVAFGPRPAGSENLQAARQYIVDELIAAGYSPVLYEFLAQTPLGTVQMVNIGITVPGVRKESIAIAGHYDTKRLPGGFVGANDGGSSTAILLELARVCKNIELEHSLEFIFFDGEEAVVQWTETDSLYGSRYDVERRQDEGTLGDLRALILVDMVGDADLGILDEAASTQWLIDVSWKIANDTGKSGYFTRERYAIEDDHIPYLKAGIPAIDLIDFDYPFWHTPADTLDKTSDKSLKIVGDLVYQALPLVNEILLRGENF